MNGMKALFAFIVAWFIAQITKTLIFITSHRKINKGDIVRNITKSGGMPSGHAASLTGLTAYFGFSLGIDDPMFVLSLCVLFIVVYDAINVRYAVGEQGKVLKEITKSQEMKVVEGHTFSQVCVGALLGFVVGLMVFVIFG